MITQTDYRIRSKCENAHSQRPFNEICCTQNAKMLTHNDISMGYVNELALVDVVWSAQYRKSRIASDSSTNA